MITLVIIGMFMFFIAGIWLIVNAIRHRPKKWLVICLLAGLLFSTIGSFNAANDDQIVEKDQQIAKLTKEKTTLQAELTSTKEENAALVAKETARKEKSEEKQRQLAEKKQAEKDKKEAKELAKAEREAKAIAAKKEKEARKQVQAAEKEKQEQATKEKAAEKSVASSSQKSTSSPKTTTTTPEKHGAIKGSVNKIYHVPGSTYYDRTTNVVQWFNTVEEAEAAGYRAPKR